MADNGDWREEGGGGDGGSKISGRRDERKGREGESEMEVRKEARGRKGGPQCMRDEED